MEGEGNVRRVSLSVLLAGTLALCGRTALADPMPTLVLTAAGAPEPATAALLLAGGVGVLLGNRRRRGH
jgi:hypothetical protein